MGATRTERLTSDGAWDDAVPILRQLWTDADPAFVRSWREEPGYHLFGRYVSDDLVAVAGVSVQRVLHHVRHAWIHDFVVDRPHRSQGHGAALLSSVETWAHDQDCEYVAVAARQGNDDGLAFYEREGYDRWGYVVERPL